MTTTNETVWAVGDVAWDPRDEEVVEVTGPMQRCALYGGTPIDVDLYPVVILEAGRGGPSGPSAPAGEATRRALNDPDYPFERVVAVELVAGSEPA